MSEWHNLERMETQRLKTEHDRVIAEAEARGYRKGVEDAAKAAERAHVLRGNARLAILALLEQPGEKK